MPKVNEQWTARVLNMQENPSTGPDLIDNEKLKFVEVKFCLINPNQNGQYNYPRAWTVLEHQIDYIDIWTSQGFWAFGLYELDRPIKEIHTNNRKELELIVLRRELYITPWSFVYQYKPHTVRGKTKISEWENTFRYPKQKNLPETIKTYNVEKGIVHLTKGVPEYMFDINSY